MMKKYFLILSVFCYYFSLGQQLTFQKNYYWNMPGGNEPFYGIQIIQTGNGGYVIGAGGNSSFFFIKTNNLGDTIWTKQYKIGFTTGIYSLSATPDTGYILCGSTDALNNSSSADILLVKTDKSGNIQWSKATGGSLGDYTHSIIACSDSGYIAVGSTKSYGVGNEDIYVIRLNQQGNILWTKTFGGTNQDEGSSILQTNDGGFLIGGSTNSFGTGQEDAILIKVDANGNLLWDKTYESVSGEILLSLTTTADSNYLVLTNENIIKINSNGDTLWCKGGNWGNFETSAINKTKNGGFIFSFNDGSRIIKIDSLANILWSGDFPVYSNQTTNPFFRPSNIIETSDKGYAFVRIADYTQNASVVFVKLDSAGMGGCDNTHTIGGVLPNATFTINTPSVSISSGGTSSNISIVTSSSGINVDTNCLTTGVNTIKYNEDYIIYPNPCNREATIAVKTPISTNQCFNLYDVFGRLVINIKLKNKNSMLEVGNLPSGVYFYQITKEKKIIKTGKLVIQ